MPSPLVSVLLLLVHIHLSHAAGSGTIDYDQNPEIKLRPRVVVGYVSDQQWAFVEFLCMTHSSWRYANLLPGSHEYKRRNLNRVDLIAFVHPRHAQQVATICEPLDLKAGPPGTPHPAVNSSASQCFAVTWPPPSPSVWHGYPFINNVDMLADADVAAHLTHHYGLMMKTDFDTFLSPTFLHFWPDKLTFGVQEYVVQRETEERLEQVANTLDLPPPRMHNLGPTWYGDVASVLRLAAASIPIMRHIVTQEFEQLPGGGIKQAWKQGEGWPTWSAGMGALYATELAASAVLDAFTSTDKMDAHADSDGLIAGFYHFHARHGDKGFSKFEFFEHHYDQEDLSQLQVAVARDYCTFIAVSSWRQLMEAQGHRQPTATQLPGQQQQEHNTELCHLSLST